MKKRKGTWKKYSGLMIIKATRAMSSNVKQHLAMETMDECPEELIGLE